MPLCLVLVIERLAVVEPPVRDLAILFVETASLPATTHRWAEIELVSSNKDAQDRSAHRLTEVLPGY
jgi:hypothetical protein